ncbi:MAG TPA: hypothetical protein VIR00_13025, partial [Micromonosporaceae bacterium]
GAESGSAAAGNAIAGVATIAYGAGLAAPGVIGGIASLTSLTWSFVFVATLIAIIVFAGRALAPRTAARPDEEAAVPHVAVADVWPG